MKWREVVSHRGCVCRGVVEPIQHGYGHGWDGGPYNILSTNTPGVHAGRGATHTQIEHIMKTATKCFLLSYLPYATAQSNLQDALIHNWCLFDVDFTSVNCKIIVSES